MAAATTISIASLEPGLDADSTSITGIVTLIWPYASSSQTLSLLLVEPDFRLRRNRGQVRIYFTGASAKAVARAHIASGDQLLLNLKGVKWAKDGSTATTPGKGIEWELRYGERVVLHIQRADQQLVSLDVDNPTPSPEPAAQTSTANLSSPYNSYIPTTVQKRQLDAQAWASPAFLKRSTHFAASAYDPFAEEDFLDNERRKRTKFGRGSGQWRFADRTPSPEKEPETSTFDISSPSKLPQQHRAIGKEEPLPLQATRGIENATDINSDGLKAPQILAAEDKTTGSIAPPSPPATTFEPSEIEVQREEPPIVYRILPASTDPIAASSGPSDSDQDSGSHEEEESEVETSDAAAFSGPAFDFGLDGSAFSRTKKADMPPAEEAEEPAEEMELDDETNRALGRAASLLADSSVAQMGEEIKEPQATIPETAHDFLLPDGDDSQPMSTVHDHQQAAQLRSSPTFPSSENFESEQGPELELISSEEVSDQREQPRWIAVKSQVEEEESESDEAQEQPTELESMSVEEVPFEEEQATPLPVDFHAKAEEKESVLDEVEAVKGIQMESSQAQETSLIVQEVEVNRTETKEYTVEIIDLESDDEEKGVDQLDAQRATQLIPKSLDSSVETSGEPMETLIQTEASFEETVVNGPTSPVSPDKEPINMKEAPEERLLEAEMPSKGTLFQPLTVPDSPPAVEEAPTQQLLEAEIPPKATTFQELPSTVPESFVDRSSKSQLLTPDATQRTSFVSQPSITSLQSEQDEDTSPTPRLTQGTSTSVVPLESPILQPSQDAIEVKESSPPRQETLTIRKTRSRSQKVEEETPVREGKILTPQKPPTFIERLKAMRKLSAQSPRRVSDSSATSPWFAPKRLSQVVPDSEAESETESSSDRDRKAANQKVTSTVQTPEKPKSLAAAFIRSPPQRTPQRNAISSIQSSPGYILPSQPPPPGFRTNVSYYVPLPTLASHFGTIVDVLSIVLSSTPVTRTTSGPKDYNQTIYITDPAANRQTPNTPVVAAQVFRPSDKCFPTVEKGDAILLRDFKVQTLKRQAILLSTQSSAWAVFRRSAPLDVQIRGPPVELGPEERLFARGLWRWRDNTTQVEKEIMDDKVPKEPPKKPNGITSKAKKPAKKLLPKQKQANTTDGADANIKKEGIEGLGVDLAGSQTKTRKASTKERSIDMDSVMESTEPPKRVLRPRGAIGMPERSESPTKAMMRRSGSVFTGGFGEPDG